MIKKGVQVTQRLQGHVPYLPGEQPKHQSKVIKLNTNENPYPPSPLLHEKIVAEIPYLNLYPNPPAKELRESIAHYHGLNQNQVIVGNGSDDILNLCVRVYSDSELKIGMLEPSYSLYEVLSGVQGSELIQVPFSDGQFSFRPEEIIRSGANIFFLTNPHAPSGRNYPLGQLRQIAENFSGLLVIDEAYADFAPENAISLLHEFTNVFITRTFSKSYSLAGLRVGYGLGSPNVVNQLDEVREVYNLDRIAQAGALTALLDRKYFNDCLNNIIEQRTLLSNKFKEYGWDQIPSATNFIFVEPRDGQGTKGPSVALSLFNYLCSQNILVRYFPKHPLTVSFLRISIGNSSDMAILRDAIESWMQQKL